jgi:hypothetical protein
MKHLNKLSSLLILFSLALSIIENKYLKNLETLKNKYTNENENEYKYKSFIEYSETNTHPNTHAIDYINLMNSELLKENYNNKNINKIKNKIFNTKLNSFLEKKSFKSQYPEINNSGKISENSNQNKNQYKYNNYSPDQRQILEKILRDPNTRRLLDEVKKHPMNKLFMPKEIHSTYEVTKKGHKQILINENSKNIYILKKICLYL